MHGDNLGKTLLKTPWGIVENPVENPGKDPVTPLVATSAGVMVNTLSTDRRRGENPETLISDRFDGHNAMVGGEPVDNSVGNSGKTFHPPVDNRRTTRRVIPRGWIKKSLSPAGERTGAQRQVRVGRARRGPGVFLARAVAPHLAFGLSSPREGRGIRGRVSA